MGPTNHCIFRLIPYADMGLVNSCAWEFNAVVYRKMKMAKSRVVFIFLTILLVFVVGCNPSDTKVDEPPVFKPPKLKPVYIEPDNTEPEEIITAEPEPNDVEEEQTEPEPVRNEPMSIEPNNVEPVEIKPDKSKSGPPVSFYDECAEFLKSFVDD